MCVCASPKECKLTISWMVRGHQSYISAHSIAHIITAGRRYDSMAPYSLGKSDRSRGVGDSGRGNRKLDTTWKGFRSPQEEQKVSSLQSACSVCISSCTLECAWTAIKIMDTSAHRRQTCYLSSAQMRFDGLRPILR